MKKSSLISLTPFFYRFFLVLFAVATLLLPSRFASANPIESFNIQSGVPSLFIFEITWDVLKPGGAFAMETTDFVGGTNGLGAGAVASQLAQAINTALGAGTATVNGTSVDIEVGLLGGISLDGKKTTDSFVNLDLHWPSGFFSFASDTETGLDVLIEPGFYQVLGPGGLNASFGAPVGTTATELAQMLANAMSIPGYTIIQDGSSVSFRAPTSGIISFRTDGSGIHYVLNAVPEPGTLALLAIGAFLFLMQQYGWRLKILTK